MLALPMLAYVCVGGPKHGQIRAVGVATQEFRIASSPRYHTRFAGLNDQAALMRWDIGTYRLVPCPAIDDEPTLAIWLWQGWKSQ